jgi:pimeloyl-ACP methyl ester carboxylesterase
MPATHDHTAADRAPQPGSADETVPGPGPLVVFVPGLGLDGRAWAAVRRELAGDSLVVLVPSMGGSAPRGAELGVERQGERLLAALPRGRRVVLVGHSASCPVVVEAARRTSDVVGLVLVGPVTDPQARTWPRMVSQWLRTAAHEHLWEAGLLAPQYRQTGVVTMVRGMNAVRHYRTDRALEGLSLPVSIIRGERDRIATQAWCNKLAGVDTSRVTSVDGAAHMVPLTHPRVVAAAAGSLRGEGDGTTKTSVVSTGS